MNKLTGKRVLVIGGAGFIGKQLVSACVSRGMSVLVIDTIMPATQLFQGEVEFVRADYRETDLVKDAIQNIDYVVHLAHDALLLDIVCDMDAEIKHNVLPAVKLMDACSTAGVSKLLFISSGGTVYGNPDSRRPIIESSPTHPVSVYGTTKLMIENLGFVYYAQKDLPFVVARPANAYGQGQIPFKGQGFIATALASALHNQPMSIYGDGTVVRDYTHVTDIAEALVALLECGRPGEAYNIGTARGTSLKALIEDYINAIIGADNCELMINYVQGRSADVIYNVLSNDKLLGDTGFSPRVELSEGLKQAWEWVKRNEYEYPQ